MSEALVLLPEQGTLFPEWEERLVEVVRHKSFVHTAAFLSRDEELCRAICTDLLTGVSRRLIAKRYSISRNSVNGIREAMEARGELEPLNKEIARRLNRCVIYSLENLEDATEHDKIAAGSLPIATAVLLDKKAALEGQPTSRIEHITTRKVSAEELNAWIESLPSCKAAPDLGDAPAESRPSDSASAAVTPQLPASHDNTQPADA